MSRYTRIPSPKEKSEYLEHQRSHVHSHVADTINRLTFSKVSFSRNARIIVCSSALSLSLLIMDFTEAKKNWIQLLVDIISK